MPVMVACRRAKTCSAACLSAMWRLFGFVACLAVIAHASVACAVVATQALVAHPRGADIPQGLLADAQRFVVLPWVMIGSAAQVALAARGALAALCRLSCRRKVYGSSQSPSLSEKHDKAPPMLLTTKHRGKGKTKAEKTAITKRRAYPTAHSLCKT